MPVIAPYFEVALKVFRVGIRQIIRIHPLFEHSRSGPGAVYRVSIFPFESLGAEGE